MTRWALFAGVLLSGCGPRCDQEACAPFCAARAEAAPAALSALDDHRLTVEESDQLAARLISLREGVRVDGPTGFGVCEGTDTCTRFVGPFQDELPAGAYFVTVRLRVPADGVYEGDWALVCHDQPGGKGNEVRREVRSVKFTHAQKPADVVLAHIAFDGRQRQYCDYAITPTSGWTPTTPLVGHMAAMVR
jgi:hypothetical protein